MPRPAATVDEDDDSDKDSAVGDDGAIKEGNGGMDNTVGEDYTGPLRLEDVFRREVAEIVEIIYNKMLTTSMMKQLDTYKQPERILLDPAMLDPKLGPKFRFRARPAGRNMESKPRLIGHVEYLGGRLGALTWAIAEANKNSWGSLRCVLGDVAWCMLKLSTSYGFLVSSDEIMFLRLEIDTCVEEVDINIRKPDLPPQFAMVDVLEEPHLFYSDPIKFTDVFDSTERKITVKMGLLYMMHRVVMNDWNMQEKKGRCAGYFKRTEAGEKWTMRPPKRR
ncbi:hypothetical protein ACET3X_007076 [Alternaria dauci]|uniref:Uncharacterized protein n=1 Tax=Alternaria dauci TaxID=48095 RepID=A0ABR3UGZ2_9PLEO